MKSIATALCLSVALAVGLLLVEMLVVWRLEPHYLVALGEARGWLRFATTYTMVFGLLGLVALAVSRAARPLLRSDSAARFVELAVLATPVVVAPFAFRRGLRELLLGGALGVAVPAAAALLAVGAVALVARSEERVQRRASAALLVAIFAAAACEPSLLHRLPSQILTVTGLWELAVAGAIGVVVSLPLAWLSQSPSDPRRLLLWAGLQLAAVGLLAQVRPPGIAPSGPPPGVAKLPPVLLIVADTLRADHLDLGPGPSETPNLRRFAEDGASFEHAYTVAPWTTPSFGSLFSSSYPSRHGAGRIDPKLGFKHSMASGPKTLAEALSDAGYWTGAVLTNPSVSARYALGRGFDRYENLLAPHWYHPIAFLLVRNEISRWLETRSVMGAGRGYIMAGGQVYRTLEMIERAAPSGRPWFVVSHFMDPHAPYGAPPQYYREAIERATVPGRYRAEVRYLDDELGRMFEALRAADLYDRTLIVLTSDHGEELGEQRPSAKPGPGHGHTLYEELLHVPLIVKLPSVPRVPREASRAAAYRVGEVRTDLASLIDIAPTILGGIGLQVPDEWAGRSLLAGRGVVKPLVAEAMLEGPEYKAAIGPGVKLIAPVDGLDRSTAIVYDLEADPAETTPQEFEAAGPAAEVLFQRITQHLEQGSENGASGEGRVELDPSLLHQLEALGYVQE